MTVYNKLITTKVKSFDENLLLFSLTSNIRANAYAYEIDQLQI